MAEDESQTQITGGADQPETGDSHPAGEVPFHELSDDEKHEHHHQRLNDHDEMHASHHERIAALEKHLGIEREEGEEEEGTRLSDRKMREEKNKKRKRH